MTRGTGVTATIDLQPGRPVDSESLHLVLDFETNQAVCRFKASFDALLKVHRVRDRVRDRRHQITRLQESAVKTKIQSVRSRLDRIGGEKDAARDADELKRRKILFECVFPTRCD